ncbi:MAG: hypothetical protein PF484_06520 [Bacteroidales bacterium]|jgi:hypothetical protein|nr:hypothetical protein [Bacteroidales bacterium]
MRLISFHKLSIIFLFSVLVFAACSRGPVYKSVAESKMKSEIQYIGFDNNSAIRYAISNDKEFLYIRLEALSRPSVLKIIQSGFYIYIDTLGKKNRDMWFNYPIGKTDQLFQAKLFSKEEKENDAVAGKLELESQIKDVDKFALFVANEKEEPAENDLEKGFAFHLIPGEYGSLNYYAAIRLDKIKKGGFEAIDNLNIGIISGAFKKPNLAGSRRGGRRSSRYRGMNRVPQAQQQSNVDPQKMRDMYLMSMPINFWINVELLKN